MGFPVGFTGLPAVDGVGRKERRLTAGLPRPYHPSTPASGAPLPLGGLGSRSPSPAGPSPHVGRRLPGPCSPGACQTQTGSQAKRGAPSQEDTGSTTQQRDEGDAPTARNAPPGEAGRGPRPGPTPNHRPPTQRGSSLGCTPNTEQEHGALTPYPPCTDGAPAQFQERGSEGSEVKCLPESTSTGG